MFLECLPAFLYSVVVKRLLKGDHALLPHRNTTDSRAALFQSFFVRLQLLHGSKPWRARRFRGRNAALQRSAKPLRQLFHANRYICRALGSETPHRRASGAEHTSQHSERLRIVCQEAVLEEHASDRHLWAAKSRLRLQTLVVFEHPRPVSQCFTSRIVLLRVVFVAPAMAKRPLASSEFNFLRIEKEKA